MRVKDVAKRLDISISTAYNLIESGQIPHCRHGLGRGTIRVSEEQLAQYLKNAERGRPAPAQSSTMRL
jgi:excisionase family DNA binding protein